MSRKSSKNGASPLTVFVIRKIAALLNILTAKKSAFSTNLFDCIKPVRIMAKAYGLQSFSITCTSNGEIDGCKLRRFDIFWFIVHFTLSIALSALNYSYLTPADDTWSMVLLSGMQIFLILALLLAALSIALDILNRKRLIKMLKNINDFDKQVNV